MKIVYQEDNEKKEPEESVLNPEKNHASDLSRKERRLLEKEKLSGMGLKKKLEYIWMYYKAAIFGVVLFIAAIFIGHDIYQNAQIKDILNVYAVNGVLLDTEALEAQAMEILEGDPQNEKVTFNVSMNTDADGAELDYSSQMVFATQLQVGTLDVMVMPEALYESLHEQEMFVDMEELLGESAVSFGEHLQGDCLVFDQTELMDTFPLGCKTICVAVPATSQNMEYAAQWIRSFF